MLKDPSVEEKISELLIARRKRFLLAMLKAARWLPLWLPAILLTHGTFMVNISLRLKGHDFRGSRVIVWLRRFNVSWMQAFYTNMILSEACRGFGIPITVQDSSVKVSWYRVLIEFSRGPLLRALIVFFVICVLVIWLVPEPWAKPVAMSIWVLFFGVMLRRAYWRAFLSLNTDTARHEILDLISTIRNKEDLYNGVTVVRASDSFWRDVVGTAIANADVVFVDVTDITENLKWELTQTICNLLPEAVILAYAHTQGLDQELPTDIAQEVAAVMGDDALQRCQVFSYPTSYGFLGIFNAALYQKARRKLTETIARAIVTSTPETIQPVAPPQQPDTT